MKIINVAKKFTPFPAGRYRKQALFSGEQFRDDILHPALETNEQVTVDFSDSKLPGSSFPDLQIIMAERCVHRPYFQ